MVERRVFGQRVRGLKPPPPFRSLNNFVHPTLPVSSRRDSKSCCVGPSYLSIWCLCQGRGSKISHAGKWKKRVIDSLTLEKDALKNQEDYGRNKCTLVCFNVLSYVLLDTKMAKAKRNLRNVETFFYFDGCSSAYT